MNGNIHENELVQIPAQNPIVAYKDSVFRMLFKNKKELLSLYNAINGTDYKETSELEVTTLENAIYMTMKNDVSCVLNMNLNLYEQQSTVNPNMPLRDLFYVATQFQKMVKNKDMYSRKKIILPTPRFIVFYNGKEMQPEKVIYKLSDSFEHVKENSNLELIVEQYNINKGYNSELLKNCRELKEYMIYVDTVRKNCEIMSLEKAVESAVDECISNGILREFLMNNKAEVTRMSIFEYDEELHSRTLLEEGIEIGMERGKLLVARKMLDKGMTMQEVVEITGLSEEEIELQ